MEEPSSIALQDVIDINVLSALYEAQCIYEKEYTKSTCIEHMRDAVERKLDVLKARKDIMGFYVETEQVRVTWDYLFPTRLRRMWMRVLSAVRLYKAQYPVGSMLTILRAYVHVDTNVHIDTYVLTCNTAFGTARSCVRQGFSEFTQLVSTLFLTFPKGEVAHAVYIQRDFNAVETIVRDYLQKSFPSFKLLSIDRDGLNLICRIEIRENMVLRLSMK